MSTWVIIALVGVLAVAGLCASVRILKQYERGVQFRLGRLKDGARVRASSSSSRSSITCGGCRCGS
jgi:hypothetical protein